MNTKFEMARDFIVQQIKDKNAERHRIMVEISVLEDIRDKLIAINTMIMVDDE